MNRPTCETCPWSGPTSGSPKDPLLCLLHPPAPAKQTDDQSYVFVSKHHFCSHHPGNVEWLEARAAAAKARAEAERNT